MQINSKNFPFLISDIIAFYGALLLSLLIRLGPSFNFLVFWLHLKTFSLLLGFWLLIFYIAGLYEIQNFSKRFFHLKLFLLTSLIALMFSAIFFYLFPLSSLTPKTILLLLTVCFSLINFPIRSLLYRYYLQSQPLLNVLIISQGQDAKELTDYLNNNRQLGYRVQLIAAATMAELKKSQELFKANKVGLIVISNELRRDQKLTSLIYQKLLAGVTITSLSEFYENIFGKVSLDELEEEWFLEKLIPKNRFYLFLKRSLDIIFAFVIFVLTVPFWPLVAVLIKGSSAGPIFFTQRRIGLREQAIIVSKFRTMHQLKKGEVKDVLIKKGQLNLEAKENLSRIFFFGKLLRRTHLDELPQVLNVLKGELSFIGPRVEFVEMHNYLKQQIPYYQIRTIIKPGLTGWAQIHGQTSNTVEAARQRLAYDIYYIKNRSFILDLVIALKTLRTISTFSGV